MTMHQQPATRIQLLDFSSRPMRAFHMSWFAFFLCFFAWFGIAPLMGVVKEELSLTRAQMGNIMIASVAATIFARLLVGWLCDRIGPRRSYTCLLLFGSLPVMGIGLARSYESFLLFRLGIGVIGASFVITQYHTSVMFAPNCVGTANATTAGWGNMGGGVTQMVMPLLFSALLALGLGSYWSWRAAMLIAGLVCFLTGIAYSLVTEDTPQGNLRACGPHERPSRQNAKGPFREACRDYRVWLLFLVYGACFGIELTMNNLAALYFQDYFGLGLKTAGFVAGLFGLMNLFARTLGGLMGDKCGVKWGLRGRIYWLTAALMCEGLALMLFSTMTLLPSAIAILVVFSLFVQMSEGATYSVVPFISKRYLGAAAGIVGAGGNAGAVLAACLFKGTFAWPQAFFVLGAIVFAVSFLALLIRFREASAHPADEGGRHGRPRPAPASSDRPMAAPAAYPNA